MEPRNIGVNYSFPTWKKG